MHLQPRLARRGQPHLRHREGAIEQDQEDQQRNVHRIPRRREPGAVCGTRQITRGGPRSGPAPAESAAMDYLDRRRAGLRRRARPAARRDRLFAVARPCWCAGRPGQPRPGVAGRAAPPARLGNAASCLLGNHDLHLLAVAHGVRRPHRSDTLDDILGAPDRDALARLAAHPPPGAAPPGLAVRACRRGAALGASTTLALAAEVEALLAGPDLPGLPAGDVRQRARTLGRRTCGAPTAGAS